MVPGFIAREEYELLHRHKQDNLAGLVSWVYGDLETIIRLMRQVSGGGVHIIPAVALHKIPAETEGAGFSKAEKISLKASAKKG